MFEDALNFAADSVRQSRSIDHEEPMWQLILRLSSAWFRAEKARKGCAHSSRAKCFAQAMDVDAMRTAAYAAVASALRSRSGKQTFIHGLSNAWILKPGGASKGRHISIARDLDTILKRSINGGVRIIQKYIERPLLYRGYKFDIRVWVLIQSWKPLHVYIFRPFYCRLCSNLFSMDDVACAKTHLSNYSIQRSQAEVISQVDLFRYLGLSNTRAASLVERIETVVANAVLAAQPAAQHQDGRFELYGADVMLDERLNAWLLEMNLTPGLNRRTPGLDHSISAMLNGMFRIIFEGNRDDREERCMEHASSGMWSQMQLVPRNDEPRSEYQSSLELHGTRVSGKTFSGRKCACAHSSQTVLIDS